MNTPCAELDDPVLISEVLLQEMLQRSPWMLLAALRTPKHGNNFMY